MGPVHVLQHFFENGAHVAPVAAVFGGSYPYNIIDGPFSAPADKGVGIQLGHGYQFSAFRLD